jgi:serine/threonine-protein kinase
MSEPVNEPSRPPPNQPRPATDPSATAADEELLAALADDFASRLRRGERAAVEEYVAKHPELEERIRKVLPAIALIEASRASDLTTAVGGETSGRTVGRYKLLERIGEGGFGVVYMAEQQHPVRRKVALKVIKPGMDSRQVLARFEAERQALAIMDHPNIAKVFDGGMTDSNRPYFVMELVKGVPITEFCDQQQFTPRQRLELFLQVCHAVRHAHQKGIIHRDLKPTNVLVAMHDTTPVVKVIDFGVAKALGHELTDMTLFTGFAQLVGTPLYMSPEQAGQSAIDVDTRSDIYSLGVLLYELLTGTTPFDKERFRTAAQDEIRRIIREEEPPRPSTRLSASKDSLASVSAQRHTEPAKLTRLVRGDLDWIVMKALEKDRSRRYETANGLAMDLQRYLADEAVQACPPSAGYRLRKFARRNKGGLAVAAMTLFFLVLLGSGVGWAVRDRAARRTAVEQAVKIALKEAEQWQDQSKWPEALSAAKRAEALLAGGEGKLREPVHQVRKDLEMVLRLEEIRLLSSEWKYDRFDFGSADQAYAQAFADYGIDVAGISADEAAARIRQRTRVATALVAALDDWALSQANAGTQKDRAGVQGLTALAQLADPDPWRRQVRQARKQKDGKALAALAASPELLRQPPTSLLLLAAALRASGDVEAAIEVRRQAQRQYPGDFWINFQLAATFLDLGSAYRDEAVAFFRAALAVRPQSTAVLNNLGRVLHDQGKVDEAVACYRRAIEIDPRFRNGRANLGDALAAQGKLDDAIAAFRTAIELDPNYAWVHNDLGLALQRQGKPDEAIACFRKAIELNPNIAYTYDNLGVSLFAQKKLDEAIAGFRKCIDLDPKYANAHGNLGNALRVQGKLDEAILHCRKAIELDPKSAIAYNKLGAVLFAQKKLDQAVEAYRKAIELDPKSADAHDSLGCVLYTQKKQDEAIAAVRKAIELDPKFAGAHAHLGHCMTVTGKLDEAIAAYRKAIEIDPNSKVAADSYFRIAKALEVQGKLGESIACFRQSTRLDPSFAAGQISLAWLLTTCADANLWDAAGGLEAARKSVELEESRWSWQVLGWAHYRNGDWKASIEALEKSCALDDPRGGDSAQWFFLAMAHWQLGEKDKARAWYERAVQWMDKNQPGDELLRRLQAEAAELLELKEKK